MNSILRKYPKMNIKLLSILAGAISFQPAFASIPSNYVGNNTIVFYGSIGSVSGTNQVHRNDNFSIAFTQTVVNESLFLGQPETSSTTKGNSVQQPNSPTDGGAYAGLDETVTFTDLSTGFSDAYTTRDVYRHRVALFNAHYGDVSVSDIYPSSLQGSSAILGVLGVSAKVGFDYSQFDVSLIDSAVISIPIIVGKFCGFYDCYNGMSYWNHGLAFTAIRSITKVEINPVPLPSSIWFLGSGIAGLFATRRRLKAL
jgi:hypothetical protein